MPSPRGAVIFDSRRRSRELEPLSVDRFGVHFTADAELRDLIERARALASHRLPNGDLAGLMKLMAASFVRQEEKRRFGVGVRPRRAKTETAREVRCGRRFEHSPTLQSTQSVARAKVLWCDARGDQNRCEKTARPWQ